MRNDKGTLFGVSLFVAIATLILIDVLAQPVFDPSPAPDVGTESSITHGGATSNDASKVWFNVTGISRACLNESNVWVCAGGNSPDTTGCADGDVVLADGAEGFKCDAASAFSYNTSTNQLTSDIFDSPAHASQGGSLTLREDSAETGSNIVSHSVLDTGGVDRNVAISYGTHANRPTCSAGVNEGDIFLSSDGDGTANCSNTNECFLWICDGSGAWFALH